MTMTHKKWREHECYKYDPFACEIQPALLNSVDIEKYVDKGCLIGPCDFSPDRLKTASYEIRLLGTLYDWEMRDDGRLRRRCREIRSGEKVILHRNSITYLWTKEKLRLPEYIAVRFNLHIRHVHKGILLGTGPLIDPGFFGSWLIPLHNLTNNDYELTGEEGIIWVEFTKVSKHEPGSLKPFPDKKDLETAEEYMKKSTILEHGVQSAFRGALDHAQKDAMNAKKSAEDARKKADFIRNIGLIAIVASIILIWLAGHNLIFRATEIAQDSQNQMFHTKIEKQDDRLKQFEMDLKQTQAHLIEISKSVNELKKRIDGSNETGSP